MPAFLDALPEHFQGLVGVEFDIELGKVVAELSEWDDSVGTF